MHRHLMASSLRMDSASIDRRWRFARQPFLASFLSLTLAGAGFPPVPAPTNDPGAIFVPEDRLPLSEYAELGAGQTGTLHAHPDVLHHYVNVLGAPLRIARQLLGQATDGGAVFYTATGLVDVGAGTVDVPASIERHAWSW